MQGDGLRRLAKVARNHAAAVGQHRGASPVAGQAGSGRGRQPHGPSRRIRLSRHDRQLRQDAHRQGGEVHVRPRAARPGADLAADQASRAKHRGHHGSHPQWHVPARQGRRRATRRACVLGGQGATVTGKFVGLDSWEGATYHFHPEAPHIGFAGDDASWKAFSELKASPIGPLLFRDKQPINKDGTFTIEKMLPGRYQLFLSAPGFTGLCGLDARCKSIPKCRARSPPLSIWEDIAAVNKPAKAAQARGSAGGESCRETRRETGRQDRHDPRQGGGRRHGRADRDS